MNRFLAVAATVAVAACAPPSATRGGAPVRAPREALRHAIDSLLADARFRNSHFGVLIVNPRSGDTLYSRNAGKVFMPASNMKVVTGAVALAQLGPDYRFSTSIAAGGPVTDGTVNGDLLVIGRGDPTLSDRFHGDAMTAMLAIADSLHARGIRRVTGALRPGANAFPDSIYGYGWEWDDLRSSGTPVDELFYNEGMVRTPARVEGRDTVLMVGTRNPNRAYLDALDSALALRGIVITGGVTDSVATGTMAADTIYTFSSPPLREILKHFLKPSQNQIGEVLLKTLGLERTGVGTADSGAVVVSRQLLAWGAERDGFVVYDGSGLSRHDLVSPETMLRILLAMQRDTAFAVFYDALPIAGVDGTLRTRMRGTPAAGNMRAKTGSIEFVRTLSGYITSADGERLVFSILPNHVTVPGSELTDAIDAIGVLLANYRGSPAR